MQKRWNLFPAGETEPAGDPASTRYADYFAETDELERENFIRLDKLKQEQNILEDQAFYHYDTPLTVEHEMDI